MSADPKLIDRYGGAVFDVDGVLCRGAGALPHVPSVLAPLRDGGTPFTLVTNNASRTPAQGAAWLAAMGIDVEEGEVTPAAASAGQATWILDDLGGLLATPPVPSGG